MTEHRRILDAWQGRRDETFVLGTVVDVIGSSYRKPGARTLIDPDGERIGLISGGCLERDVVRRAYEWTESGPRTVVFDTRSSQLHPEGRYGTGCEGLVKLLLERVEPGRCGPLEALSEAHRQHRAGAIATVYDAGGAEGHVGARRFAGLPGGDDPLPKFVVDQIQPLLDAAPDWSRPKSCVIDGEEDVWRVLVEPIEPPLDVLIFGAGDDVQPVVQLGARMGWNVRVAGIRPVLATSARFPDASEVVGDAAEALIERIPVHQHTHVLIMTHSFKADAALIPAMLDTDAPFVGLLGPRSRTGRLIERLGSEDRLPNPEQLERLQTPLGLDLGAESPTEVALSIVSAVLAAHRGGDGSLLQQRDGRIHPVHERLDRRSEGSE